jgi:hypothetical protein
LADTGAAFGWQAPGLRTARITRRLRPGHPGDAECDHGFSTCDHVTRKIAADRMPPVNIRSNPDDPVHISRKTTEPEPPL